MATNTTTTHASQCFNESHDNKACPDDSPETTAAGYALEEISIRSPAEESGDGSLSTPVLLSADDVAKIFNRSKRTVRDWIRAGHLRPVRIGRAVFFRADDITELLNAGGPSKT